MALLEIKGIRINFPFKPYPCQVIYMEKVLQCLQQEENGVLESPTGTGKTLCLLCASLAWLEGRKAQVEFNRHAGAAAIASEVNLEQSTLVALAASLQKSTGSASWGSNDFVVPKIIYASRTHSQLSQAVQELKRTAYNGLKMAIIGSRDQLCINEQIKKEKNNNIKVHLCRAKVAARRCHYYNVLEDLKKNTEPRQIVGCVADIEDLLSHGMKSKICPYYLARELKSDADIIFMPYNYLLDPKTRRAHNIELAGNIVIFDEAHNLERICEESASFDLSSVDLATAIEETTQLGVRLTEMVSSEMNSDDTGDGATMPAFTLEDIIKLKKTLLELEELIDTEPLVNNQITKPGLFMFELMAKVNITFGNKNIVIDLMDKMIAHFSSDGTSSALHSKGAGLSKIVDALKIIFNQEPGEMASVSQHRQSLARHYKVHIQLKERSNQKKKKIDSWASVNGQEKGERMISYWCFSPGYSMQDLKNQGVKSIILTSGTLSPIESFTAELQIPFPVRLENSHVIQKHQVWLGTLGCGPDGTVLNSNYQNRFTDAYQSSLGNAIVNFARVVPNGLLVFFPSYPVMEKCVEKWRNSNIWERIVAYKPVVLEPRGQDAFMEAIDDFYKKINDETMNGAVFMAVCRGKVSEGLDFADMNGRAVVLTGLPFPPMKDPRVILKMQHLDDLTGKEGYKSFTGQQWYRQQATRAVNQAIGRVIRHKDDFGAILLCDSRFSASESIMGLPMWIKPYVTKYDNFGRAIKDMLVFFKLAEKVLPAPQRRPNRQKSGGRPGCAGAYFEPTVSRHKVSLEPASYVQCHVPGLSKRKHLEDDISSLKSQYSKSDGNTAHDSGNQRKGLLHALDSTEKCIGSYNNMQEPQSNSFEGTVTIHPKRRKIIIKPTGYAAAASSGKPAVSTSDSSSNKTPGSRSGVHLNRAENYVSELKAVLTTLEYKNFSSALQEYKKSGNLNAVTPVLADLFTSNPGRSHLFCKFYRFVRPHHKAEFEQLSLSLTGQSCGYKPEHALTNKRLGPASAQVSAGSQSKLSSISSISKSSLGRWSSVDLPVSTSQRSFLPESASRAQNGPTTLTSISTACHSSNISTANLQSVQLAHSALGGNSSLGLNAGNEDDISQVDNLTTAKSSNFSDDTRLRNSSQDGESSHLKTSAYSLTVKTAMGNHTSGTTVLLNKPEKSDQALKTMSVTDHDKSEHSRTGGCSLEVNVEKIHSMQNETNKNHPDTGYRCIKCKQKAHVPFQLPACGHICCFRCWDRILTDDKRCPGGCGELFRRRHLQQLMFGSGDDIRCSSGPKPNIRHDS